MAKNDSVNVSAKKGLSKYQGLALSLLVLVTLIIGLLLINFFSSGSLQKSSVITIKATQQNGLVEVINNELFQMNSNFQKVLPYDENKEQLKSVAELFGSNLKAFSDGGELLQLNSNGTVSSRVQIDPLEGNKIERSLEEAKVVWADYEKALEPIFNKPENTQSELIQARDVAVDKSDKLQELMDELLTEIQDRNDKLLFDLESFQILGIMITIFMFLWTIFVTVRKLLENDKEVDRAQQETQGILNTVKEGLFLLDNDLVISSQHSQEMLEIFETEEIAGRDFSNLISDVVESSEMSTVEEFIKLLFDEHVIEDLIGSLNPLDKVEVDFDKADGTTQKKFLNFAFFRVLRDGEIYEVLVSVRDITARVLLEQELESTREQGEQQVEMLVSFLHAEPKMLRNFLVDSRESLGDVNSILREPVSDKADLKAKIDKMFIAVHRMKGEASAMNFDAFAERAHEFESDLSNLKKVTNIKGIDFLPLTIRLDKLISYTDTLNELSSRIQSGQSLDVSLSEGGETTFMTQSVQSISQDKRNEWDHLDELVNKVADDTGKKVHFISSGLVESELTELQQKMIKDVSIQLLRNSIVHGIEKPEIRKVRRKSSHGRIDLRLASLPDGSVELVVRDDGNGLDIKSIRERIVAKGLAKEPEVESWSDQKIVSMAFSSGFSTSSEVDMNSGRGVGLDIIRDSVKKIGGQLRLRQSAGKYCQFEITLPGQEQEAA